MTELKVGRVKVITAKHSVDNVMLGIVKPNGGPTENKIFAVMSRTDDSYAGGWTAISVSVRFITPFRCSITFGFPKIPAAFSHIIRMNRNGDWIERYWRPRHEKGNTK